MPWLNLNLSSKPSNALKLSNFGRPKDYLMFMASPISKDPFTLILVASHF